ncbi:MAG: helix-turn-helix transcriptional regulator [Clostridia bacterium]|nr:helix-turn-helix transcriptional regulator [Clostridia bacterium]MBQ7048098.1 helix-turn-helix transcriptional regulator [Clostridia bacterium]
MDLLRKNIASNIAKLRNNAKLTQAELAETLSYSDKSISKWERGESVPDIYVLNTIAEMFGVTVDYLLEEHRPEEKVVTKTETAIRNKKLITIISMLGFLLLVTVAFTSVWAATGVFSWIAFVIAVPIEFIILLVFNSVWFNRHNNLYIVSGIVWSILAAIYLSFLVFAGRNIWMLFVIGAPAQIVTYLCFKIKKSAIDSAKTSQ